MDLFSYLTSATRWHSCFLTVSVLLSTTAVFIFLIHIADLSLYHAALGKPQAIIPESSDAAEGEESNTENNQTKKKGMILPFEPHSITFDDIKYSVDMPQVGYNLKRRNHGSLHSNYKNKIVSKWKCINMISAT